MRKTTLVALFAAFALSTSAIALADHHEGKKGHECSEECMKNCAEKHDGKPCKEGECPMHKKGKKKDKAPAAAAEKKE